MAYLVTGSMGCIGAWTLYHLVKAGKEVISFDLSENRSRLNLLLTPEEQTAITFIKGDLTDFIQVLETCKSQQITHIIHLAALQVPFCRANPILGSQVNVVGTVNIFEAARQIGLPHVAFASSMAVYGPSSDYPPGLLAEDAPFAPRTLYGVYKVANEGTAKIYWQDHNISSIVLRPYTVYGVGRDQGMTSEPTKAMLAAAAGKPHHIGFGGKMQFHFASDAALQFIEAAERPVEQPAEGAHGFNLGGDVVDVAEVVAIIQGIKPGVSITHAEAALPFSDGAAAPSYAAYTRVPVTPLTEGIQQTLTHFEHLLKEGLLNYDG